jgi:proteasome lid subunit RPN8/RPN11
MAKEKRKLKSPRRRVRFSPYAWGVLSAYFGWGANGPWNSNEQICALGGRITRTEIRVESALPMLGAGATPSSVRVKAETWMNAIWTLEDIGMALVGSVHSHPRGLPVFMSGEDIKTHRGVFPDGVSVVLNPQRMEIAAFDSAGARQFLKLPKTARNTAPKKIKG